MSAIGDKEKTRKLVLAGIFLAIIMVMTVVPYTGYISVGVISITLLHIPVIIGSVYLGWKYGALIGGFWGVTCLIKAFAEPIPANIPFQNPIISVLPRIVVGIVAGALYACLSKKMNKHVSALIAAVAATLTNTVLVLTALYLFNSFEGLIDTAVDIINAIITTIIAINGVIEFVLAAAIVPIVCEVLARSTAHPKSRR